MNEANHEQATNAQSTSESTNPELANPDVQTSQAESEQLIDPRELVYRGGYSGDPREIVENPAVAPEMVEQAPEDLRDDLMPKEKDTET